MTLSQTKPRSTIYVITSFMMVVKKLSSQYPEYNFVQYKSELEIYPDSYYIGDANKGYLTDDDRTKLLKLTFIQFKVSELGLIH